MQATHRGQKEIVICLLDMGVPINTPLPWEIFDIDHDFSRDSLLTIARTVEMGCFALHLAIAQGDEAMVRLLLDGDANPDIAVFYSSIEGVIFRKWKSPLEHAAALGNVNIAQLLVNAGSSATSPHMVSLDMANVQFRYTDPLIEAAGAGHVDMIEFWLRNGADPNCNNLAGITPLAAAIMNDFSDASTLLIQRGANVS
jgi:ankyrin repeat protein